MLFFLSCNFSFFNGSVTVAESEISPQRRDSYFGQDNRAYDNVSHSSAGARDFNRTESERSSLTIDRAEKTEKKTK